MENSCFHHSIFSTASHVDDGDIITRRNELPQVFKDLDIDVVLMGHDHVYTRTYMMDGTTPDTSKGVQSSVTNPTGILYLTAKLLLPVVNTMISKLRMPNIPLRWINLTEER